MHETYGDGSEHLCCDKCGFCYTCGDCETYGCGGPKRTIIAGSRTVTDFDELQEAIKGIKWKIGVVLSGAADGADLLGERWAEENDVLLERYPADWKKFGKSAGFLRNKQMAECAEALVALWDGKSKGTKHMIDLATEQNMLVYVHRVS